MNKTSEYELTIVVPVYNEEDNMERLEKELSAFLPKAAVKSCVLFVNDGSKDSSLEKIKAICERQPDFYYISSSANHGLSTAIKAAIDMTESRLIGYQLVAGIRANRKDSAFKNLQSKIANGFRRKMTGDTATDTGCPLKVMWTDYAKQLPFFDGMHRFLPALMMLVDGKFCEMPVQHFPRIAGVSKYHLYNRLVSPFIDCFAYRWMKKRFIRYDIDQTNTGLA